MDDRPSKPDLDLIQMVQQARLMHDRAAQPSQVSAVYWIESKCETENCQPPTPRAGQWVLNTTLEKVDAQWEKIREATQLGQLGYKSRVSTSSRSGQSRDSRSICVMTYDAEDAADIQRIRLGITALGIEGEWYYEAEK